MRATPRALAKGILSFIPSANSILIGSRLARSRLGGADSARYCYSVWLRRMVMAYDHGLPANPRVVAELGPGASLPMSLGTRARFRESFGRARMLSPCLCIRTPKMSEPDPGSVESAPPGSPASDYCHRIALRPIVILPLRRKPLAGGGEEAHCRSMAGSIWRGIAPARSLGGDEPPTNAAPWKAEQEVGALLQPVSAALAPYRPSQRYHLLDERHVGQVM